MDKIINIVYDVDDVLNNLNAYVFNTLKVPAASRFNIRECTEYTKEQQDEILQMYSNPETFRNITYVEGAREICDVEKSGRARVWINSRNLTQEIAEIKQKSLLESIPDLKANQIEMQIGAGDKKKISSFADIVIEDCLGNILMYEKHTTKILINKNHNQAKSYGISDSKEGIIRVPTLVHANLIIRKMVDNWC